MSTKILSAQDWLKTNQTVIKWRLIGPAINNPFDSQAANDRLEAYATDRSALMEVCSVQALMDDTVLLKISDLISMKFETEHPKLVELDRDTLKRYLESTGVWDDIGNQFKKFQSACKDELTNRGAPI
jgi:hypothetical protein